MEFMLDTGKKIRAGTHHEFYAGGYFS